METATLAGGCFWCTEAIFRMLSGVKSVVSGYSGGEKENPSYEDVCTGQTGHAEAIQIEFDPKIISYDKILEIFFHLHDPTTLNAQGNDVGTQYRSVIFYHDEIQKSIAEKVKKRIEEEEIYNSPIVTKLSEYKNFYKAEEDHQKFYEKNPEYGYCRVIIDPKIKKLLREFKNDVRESQ